MQGAGPTIATVFAFFSAFSYATVPLFCKYVLRNVLQTLESTSPLTISIIFNALCFETHRYSILVRVSIFSSIFVIL